jgi:FKBP-type peptidyl-prolyl cis-trans isomerase FkpA
MIASLIRPFLCLLVATLVFNPAWGAGKELATDDEKMFYYLGTALSANLVPLQLSEDEVDLVLRGIREALRGNAIELDAQAYGERLNTVAQERMSVGAEQESAAANAYVAEMAAEEGAIKTPSGIVILELMAGDGDSPSPDSTVKAHYHGTLRDGTVFDSSVERGQPFTSSLSNVIPCWREAIPMIKEGGKSKITCPPDLAYGDRGSGPVPAGAALTFEVELIENLGS